MINIQDFTQHKDIEFTLKVLEGELEKRIQNRNNGHWLSPQLENQNDEIQLLRWSIGKIRENWKIN